MLSDPRRTAVVIDPPRAGCSDLFIAQLLCLRPARVVYVSCSPATQVLASSVSQTALACPQKMLVSSPMYMPGPADPLQARDCAALVAAGYRIACVQPFDMFPHTRHIECVVTLTTPVAS